MVPNRFYPRYKLLLLYEKIGNEEKCKDLAALILNMDVKIPSKTVDMIRAKASDIIIK